LKGALIAPAPLLVEEDGTRGVELHRNRDGHQERPEDKECDPGHADVQEAFKDVLCPLELWDLNVDQGQAFDRPEMDARTGDIRELVGQHQVCGCPLQLPAEGADVLAPPAGLAGDDHGIDGKIGGRDGDVCRVGNHRNRSAFGFHRGLRVARECHPHHVVGGAGILNLADHVFDVGSISDHDDSREVVAEKPLAQQPPAPEPAFQHKAAHAEGECEHEEAACDVDLECQETDCEEAKRDRARVDHLFVLGGPDPDDAGVPSVEDPQGRDPAEHDEQGDQPVVGPISADGCLGTLTAEPDDQGRRDRGRDDAHVAHQEFHPKLFGPDQAGRLRVDADWVLQRRCRHQGELRLGGGKAPREGQARLRVRHRLLTPPARGGGALGARPGWGR